MRARCDLCIAVPLTMMEQIEDAHVVIHHIITLTLRERFSEYAAAQALLAPVVASLDD
jgi:hypothetical protein